MSKDDMDIDMTSPPSSPRPSQQPLVPDNLPPSSNQSRTNPIPIAPVASTAAPRRFQPPIPNSSASAFAPLPAHAPTAPYTHNMFKPKSSRTPAAVAVPHTQQPAMQHPRSLHTTSRFSPITTPIAKSPSAPLRSTPPSMSPQSFDPSTSRREHSPDAPENRRPLKRTAPLQIPLADAPNGSPEPRPVVARSAGIPTPSPIPSLSSSLNIPQSLPNISPSYPATLFGGLSADDEHVTVWEPQTGKTVAGNAAPYRRNLLTWLKGHPGWEEKADELKSSKRRSAARRSKNAAEAFAALCCYPVATFLATEAAKYLQALGDGDHCNEDVLMMWTTDDFVRLQEALFRLGQDCHAQSNNNRELTDSDWANVTSQIGGAKMQGTVVYCAHHMLTRGITKSQRELAGVPLPSSFGAVSMAVPEAGPVGSPGSVGSYDNTAGGGPESFGGPSSMPALQVGLGASFLDRSFRAPREPRVTVWNPSNGRTISGNAAPCRRNLEAWMRQHPGWRPKEETQLSSSRRNRNRKIRPSSMPSAPEVLPIPSSVEPESPHFNDALEGLLHLSKSPSAVSPPTAQLEAQVARVEAEAEHGSPTSTHMDSVRDGNEMDTSGGSEAPKKLGITSSVSSSSAEDAGGVISDDEEIESSKMEL